MPVRSAKHRGAASPAIAGRWLHAGALLLVMAACSGQGDEAGPGEKAEVPTMNLSSPAFERDAPIPALHTCDGEDVSPPLHWSGVPAEAKSLVLIVDDPDAPDPAAPQRTWVHWVLYNLPADAEGLPEGASATKLREDAREGRNDWKRTGYGGPCPPIGRHRYFHKLYALDTVLPDLHQPTKPELLEAMEGHVLAQAQLVGTYQRER